MPTTPNAGLPYPLGTDPPAGADQIKALAEAVDAALYPTSGPYMRALTSAPSIGNDTNVPMTGGYTAVTPEDDGNALISYSAGVLTAVKACYVDVTAYAGWTGNTVGYRRMDVTIAGTAWRTVGLATGIGVTFGQTVTATGVYLPAGQTIQVSFQQNSGASLSIVRHDLRVVVRRT